MLPFFAPLLANPFLRTAGIALAAFLGGFFYCWASVPTVDVPAIIRNAEDGRDAYWNRQIALENEAHEHALVAALAAAQDEPATPADMAERMRLCRASKACRDKDRGQQLQSVQIP